MVLLSLLGDMEPIQQYFWSPRGRFDDAAKGGPCARFYVLQASASLIVPVTPKTTATIDLESLRCSQLI
jgi:hypothetical protein